MHDEAHDDEMGNRGRSKSKTLSNTNDRHYNYGMARRMNLLAAFFNCVYLIFTFVFDWVENLHHIMEHWDADQSGESAVFDMFEEENRKL